jgi:hypothetical protein
MTLPTPLVPPECDLRGLPFMALDIVRLFSSTFNAIANDSEWRAGLTLWAKAHHELPAGSLPQDDACLAQVAGLGRDMSQWKKVKKIALRGWFKCVDGRLYHPVVAEKVLAAWMERLVARKRSKNGNNSRWKKGSSVAEIEDAIETAKEYMKALDNLPPAIPKRSIKDRPSIPQRSPSDPLGSPIAIPQRSQGKGKGSPSGIPSQDVEPVSLGGVVEPHVRAREAVAGDRRGRA